MHTCGIVRLWAILIMTAAFGASLASLGAAHVSASGDMPVALHA